MEQQSKAPVLILNPKTEIALKVMRALASPKRLGILDLLSDQPRNVSEIATAMNMPLSTANLHISGLEDAGLLITDLRPGERGLQKVCARAYTTITIQFPVSDVSDMETIEMAMPIGAFVESQVVPTCGLLSSTGIIGMLDDPSSFYEPNRSQAQLLWFHHGYVEYRFPNRLPTQATVSSVQLSMEVCSEAPLHHPDWPSDITIWVNDVEIGTWTSPADFGGQRGVLTPDWWETNNTQHGLLKVWQIRPNGSFVDGMHCSDVTLNQLALDKEHFISVRIGVKSDTQHIGGINIFGESFGNYPQNIVLSLRYQG